ECDSESRRNDHQGVAPPWHGLLARDPPQQWHGRPGREENTEKKIMLSTPEQRLFMTRRHFLGRAATGIGTAALASLLNPAAFAASEISSPKSEISNLKSHLKTLHITPKAKRVIYLFQSGGPSQMDLFAPKPALASQFDNDLPDSIRK